MEDKDNEEKETEREDVRKKKGGRGEKKDQAGKGGEGHEKV